MSESLSYHSHILHNNNSRQVSLPRFSEIKEQQVEEDSRSSHSSGLFDKLWGKRQLSKFFTKFLRMAARANKKPIRRIFKQMR